MFVHTSHTLHMLVSVPHKEKNILVVLIAVHIQLYNVYSNVDLANMFYISSQEREISVPILSLSAFLRSCIKLAVPRARVRKRLGMRERKTRHARPSLLVSIIPCAPQGPEKENSSR